MGKRKKERSEFNVHYLFTWAWHLTPLLYFLKSAVVPWTLFRSLFQRGKLTLNIIIIIIIMVFYIQYDRVFLVYIKYSNNSSPSCCIWQEKLNYREDYSSQRNHKLCVWFISGTVWRKLLTQPSDHCWGRSLWFCGTVVLSYCEVLQCQIKSTSWSSCIVIALVNE